MASPPRYESSLLPDLPPETPAPAVPTGPPDPPSSSAPPTAGRDDPPPYEMRAVTAAPEPDEVLPPATFVIHGRFIYPMAHPISPSTGGEPDSVPAYQLSRAIHLHDQGAEDIEFSRMDPRVRTAADGTPEINSRAKDIYTLHHRRPLVYSGVPFSAHIEPHSRKTLGRVGIKKTAVFQLGYRAVQELTDDELGARKRQGLPVPKKNDYFWSLRERGAGSKDWKWIDPKGVVVANQIREPVPGSDTKAGAQGDGGDMEGEEVHKLEVLVPLTRRKRDALVALWCLWMLHIHIEECKPRKTWEDRKRILHAPTGAYYTGMPAYTLTMSNPDELHVAIIGAGITGVVLALGLQACRVSYTVYERRGPAPQDRVSGAGIGFSPNAERAMGMVHPGVLAAFKRVATPNGEDLFQFVDGYTDSVLYALPVGKDGFQGGLRHDFLNAWLNLLPDGVVQYDMELDKIISTDSTTSNGRLVLTFKDGTTAEADAVIGCDGLHSRVRDLLYPDPPATDDSSPAAVAHPRPLYTGKYCYRALAPISLAVAALGEPRSNTRFMYIGRGAHIITYPVGGSELLNVLVVLSEPEPEPESGADGTTTTVSGTRDTNTDGNLASAFRDWAPRPRRAGALLEDARAYQLRLRGSGGEGDANDDRWLIFDFADRPLPRYVLPDGRICVAGDAADATAPHLGAGGMGIEDALVLSEVLAEVGRRVKGGSHGKVRLVGKAFEAYNAVRRFAVKVLTLLALGGPDDNAMDTATEPETQRSSSNGLVLLTGGTGFVASHVLDCLLDHDFEVVVTARSNDKGQRILKSLDPSIQSRVSFAVVPDIAREGAFDEVFRSKGPFDYVVHTASPYKLHWDDPVRDCLDPAIKGTTGLLAAVHAHAPTVKRVVITSSSAAMLSPPNHPPIYDESCWADVTWEQATSDPEHTYRGSKKFAERAAWDFVAEHRPTFDLAVINNTYTFGPLPRSLLRSSLATGINTSNQRIYDLVSGKMRSGVQPTAPVFTFVDVRDVALAHIRAMTVPEAGGKRFYVVGG
ncbi:hypothetical protein VTJ49DRAFT_2469 [Mycothermus thermophilus]|uniref:NAD-dependent epimerase/dehydratase domain-containing protein n=1 Tax=Humicola insolens TaxID=85995 RepID=A0ABR3VA28_HUMIN